VVRQFELVLGLERQRRKPYHIQLV
jgi:hypothetical protein